MVHRLAFALAIALAGCASPQPPQSDAHAVALPAPAAADPRVVTVDSGQGGQLQGAVSVADTSYHAQDIVAFTAADIFDYVVDLLLWNGHAFVPLSPPVEVILPQVPAAGPLKTQAVFTHLLWGHLYEAAVTARGDVNASDDALVLNTPPATVTFGFFSHNNAFDNQSVNVQVTLNPATFQGTGIVTMASPADGLYQNPSATETGNPQ